MQEDVVPRNFTGNTKNRGLWSDFYYAKTSKEIELWKDFNYARKSKEVGDIIDKVKKDGIVESRYTKVIDGKSYTYEYSCCIERLPTVLKNISEGIDTLIRYGVTDINGKVPK